LLTGYGRTRGRTWVRAWARAWRWARLRLGRGRFAAVFAPVFVTGTDPTKLHIWALLAAIAGVVPTWILCNFVRTASFDAAEPTPISATSAPTADAESAAEDPTGTLRRLAQLRDSGVITEAEFQTKKEDLLSRI
ncbi:MAG TPA: SHOCT domain-containing protein, partial [Acidimicrobiales bacterium]|nr:SHOCT domain-containing protein [Acidimicrobiales bacterium]